MSEGFSLRGLIESHVADLNAQIEAFQSGTNPAIIGGVPDTPNHVFKPDPVAPRVTTAVSPSLGLAGPLRR